MSTPRTMSSSVTGRRSSGSITPSSACRIASRFGSILQPSVAICRFVTWASMVWRNLLRRPARTVLTVAGVALGVGLIVALLSLATGVERTAEQLIHVGRADFGPASSSFFGVESTTFVCRRLDFTSGGGAGPEQQLPGPRAAAAGED